MAAAPSYNEYSTFSNRFDYLSGRVQTLQRRGESILNGNPFAHWGGFEGAFQDIQRELSLIERNFQDLQTTFQRFQSQTTDAQSWDSRNFAHLHERIGSLTTLVVRALTSVQPANPRRDRDMAAELIRECVRIEQDLSYPGANLGAITFAFISLQDRASRVAAGGLNGRIQALHGRIERARSLAPSSSLPALPSYSDLLTREIGIALAPPAYFPPVNDEVPPAYGAVPPPAYSVEPPPENEAP